MVSCRLLCHSVRRWNVSNGLAGRLRRPKEFVILKAVKLGRRDSNRRFGGEWTNAQRLPELATAFAALAGLAAVESSWLALAHAAEVRPAGCGLECWPKTRARTNAHGHARPHWVISVPRGAICPSHDTLVLSA
jgi:hypothetical protein